MTKNTNIKKLANTAKSFKVVPLAVVVAFILDGCATVHKTTFIMQYNNKMLLKDTKTEEEIVVDCSKSDQDTKQLKADFDYLVEGDPIDFKTSERYDAARWFSLEGNKITWPVDSANVRRDKARIKAFKEEAQQQR